MPHWGGEPSNPEKTSVPVLACYSGPLSQTFDQCPDVVLRHHGSSNLASFGNCSITR